MQHSKNVQPRSYPSLLLGIAAAGVVWFLAPSKWSAVVRSGIVAIIFLVVTISLQAFRRLKKPPIARLSDDEINLSHMLYVHERYNLDADDIPGHIAAIERDRAAGTLPRLQPPGPDAKVFGPGPKMLATMDRLKASGALNGLSQKEQNDLILSHMTRDNKSPQRTKARRGRRR